MAVTDLKNILSFDYNKPVVGFAGIFIIIISVLFTIFLGLKSLILLAVLGFFLAIYKSKMNLVWTLLALQSIVFYFSITFGNLFGYLMALTFIGLWLSESILDGFKYFEFSTEINWLFIWLLFIAIISILPGGISKSELYTIVRITILFLFILAFYNSFQLKDTVVFFIALSIPIVIDSCEIIRIYLSTGSLFNFINLIRLKPGGIFLKANAAGFMFLLSSPFWIAMSLWHEKLSIKLISFAISFMLVTGLILTNARASIVGLLVSIFFISLWRRKLKYYFGVILLLLIIIFSVPEIKDLISTVARIDRGVTSRDVIWANTIEIIRDNPIFGVGIGNYASYYDQYFILGWERGFFEIMPHAHNLILSKTAEMGIFGLIWVIFLYILPVKAGLDLLKNIKTNRDKAITYGILATISGIYAQSLFEAGGMMQVARFFPDAIFWMLFAVIVKAKNRSQYNEKEEIFFESKMKTSK